MKAFQFIPPSLPVLAKAPPCGNDWIHEVKFDGFRLQAHINRGVAKLYSKNGWDFGPRFKALRERVAELPVKSAIVDAELVACDAEGRPDFRALIGGQRHSLVLWCFDLIEIDGTDMRPLSLVTRRARLKAMIKQADDECIRNSDTFKNPEKLLCACDERGLEGIVSKKAGQPYQSGRNAGWIKVKCHEWRAANAGRWELFQKKNPGAARPRG